MVDIRYRSKAVIENKLKQIRFIYHKRLKRYEDKVFIVDKDTGCHPLSVDFASFVTQCRSILQYALTEIDEYKNKDKYTYTSKRKLYDKYVGNVPIFKFFKDLRGDDIHVAPSGHYTTIHADVKLTFDSKEDFEKHIKEKKGEYEKAKITYEISKIIEPSIDLFGYTLEWP